MTIVGGARTHTIEKISAFARLYESIILSCFKIDPQLNIPFKTISPKNLSNFTFINQVFFELWTLFHATRYFKASKYNILLLRFRPCCWINVLGAALQGWNIVFEPNDNIQKQYILYNQWSGIKKVYILFCLRVCFLLCRKTICHSSEIKQWVDSHYKNKTNRSILSSMGSNEILFKSIPRMFAREKLKIPAHKRIVLDTGTLTPWGGADKLLYGLRSLQTNHRTTIHLLLLGKGDLLSWCQNFIQEHGLQDQVTVYDGVEYDLVPYYIAAADLCFCLKSSKLSVSSPNRLYEYLMCERQVVMTQAHQKYFTEFESIVYVDPDDPEAVAQSMISCHSSPTLLKRDCEYTINMYSWNSVAKKLSEQLEKM